MKKLSKKEMDKMQTQMGISKRKTLKERGPRPRSVVFVDKKKKANKEMCRKKIFF